MILYGFFYTAKNPEKGICNFLETEDFFLKMNIFCSQDGELFAVLRTNANFEKESSFSRKGQIFFPPFLAVYTQ